MPGLEASVKSPQLNARIMLSPGEDFLYLDLDSVRVNVNPDSLPKSAADSSAFTFPDFRLPIALRSRVFHTEANVSGVGKWSVDSLEVGAHAAQSAELSFKNLRGTFVERALCGKGRFSWQGDFLSANANVRSEDGDSVAISVSAPRTEPGNLSGTFEASVADPRKWDRGQIPDEISLKNIRADASFSVRASRKKFSFDTRLRTNLGELWPLPPLSADIRVKGSERGTFQVGGNFLGKKSGERISFEGSLDQNLAGEISAEVQNIEAEFGPEMQPLDVKVSAKRKPLGPLEAKARTRAGSLVEAKIFGLTKGERFRIAYTGDIAPDEPWAVKWCNGHLRFNTRPQVRGSFADGKMEADVSIAPVEYAYFMAADSFFTHMILDETGIDFDSGFVRGKRELFSFSGDVRWTDSLPHTSWTVKQLSDSGYAKAFVTFEPAIKSEAFQVKLENIPFEDPLFLHGLSGIVTGTFDHNFDEAFGSLSAKIETEILQIPLRGKVEMHNANDTAYLDHAELTAGTNSILFEGSSLILRDSLHEFDGFQLLDAWAATEKFNIPLLLAPYGSPLSNGLFSGNVSFKKGSGLQGTLQFSDIELAGFSRDDFSIPKLDVFAEKEKMQISGQVSAGERAWNGDLQIDVNGLLEPMHHIFLYYTTPVGGTAWLDGTIDSTFKWQGKAQLSGSWFLPQNLAEIVYTDFKANAHGDLHYPLDSLQLEFHSDSTALDTKRGFPILPVSFQGNFRDGIFSIPTAKLANSLGETIEATASYNVKDRTLGKVDLRTERFSLTWDRIHQIQLNQVTGSLTNSEKEFALALDLENVTYKLDKPEWGKGDASARGKAVLHLPHAVNGSFSNPTLEGNILLDRAVYRNDFSVDIGFGSLNKISSALSNFFTKIRRTKPVVRKSAAKSRPINLAVHIGDSQRDTVAILTNLANFPLTVDLWVLGTSDHPLLRGDVNNAANGTIGLKDLFQFNLETFSVSFQDVPWNRGTVNISSVQNLPYCKTGENRDENETCPVRLDILGTVLAPKPMPSANCGVDDSPASLYYSVLLGCISEEESSTIDRNKVAGKLIGSVISSTANKTLGGEYVGDIDMKFKLFDEETISEKDSSYLMIPISLDRWVKDLRLVFGYKQDQSETPTYDRALEAGVSYIIPAFSEEDRTKNPEHYSPQLSLDASLVSKNYLTTTEEDENRVEKNIGFNYSYRFWSPCLLGLGKCADEKKKEAKK